MASVASSAIQIAVEPVQRTRQDADEHGGGKRRDPDGAMDPQAEDGGEEQDEGQVGSVVT